MKRMIVITAALLAFGSGSVFAGGCHYGSADELVAFDPDSNTEHSPIVDKSMDPKLLALLIKQQALETEQDVLSN